MFKKRLFDKPVGEMGVGPDPVSAEFDRAERVTPFAVCVLAVPKQDRAARKRLNFDLLAVF